MDQDPANWRELCEAAATEQDPNKLMALVAQINRALDALGGKPDSACREEERSVTEALFKRSTRRSSADDQTCQNDL